MAFKDFISDIGRKWATRGSTGYDEILESGINQARKAINRNADDAVSATRRLAQASSEVTEEAAQRASTRARMDAAGRIQRQAPQGNPILNTVASMDRYNANTAIGGQAGYSARRASNQAVQPNNIVRTQISNQAIKGNNTAVQKTTGSTGDKVIIEANKGNLFSSLGEQARKHPIIAGTLAAGGVGTASYLMGKRRGRRDNKSLYRY